MGMGNNGQVGTDCPFALPTCCSSHAIVMCQAEEYNKLGGGVTTTPESKTEVTVVEILTIEA
jgi:hypothetical protein